MATPLTDSINALTAYANETTGKQDTTLSDAVGSLVEWYGGGSGVWESMQITAPSSYSIFGDIRTWIDSVKPSGSRIFVLKDNIVASNALMLNEYIGTEIINGVNTYFFKWNSIFRTSGTNNVNEACVVNAGDTFTVFYQS